MTGAADDLQTGMWQQGSLLPEGIAVGPSQWVHPDTDKTKTVRKDIRRANPALDGTELSTPVVAAGHVKPGERLMVVTQTCDLTKPADQLPQLEVARVFRTANQRIVAQAQDFGSARYFRLNDAAEPEAVVLDYGQRALLEKGFVQVESPDNELVDAWEATRGKTLARWLAQRYGRPAIPDEDYDLITQPVRDAWQFLPDEQADAFNREYAEWRYRREDDGSLTLYILAVGPEPDELVALELIDFLTQAIGKVFPFPVRVASDRRSYHSFTKADELATEQIYMEWASHGDALADAALPGGR